MLHYVDLRGYRILANKGYRRGSVKSRVTAIQSPVWLGRPLSLTHATIAHADKQYSPCEITLLEVFKLLTNMLSAIWRMSQEPDGVFVRP